MTRRLPQLRTRGRPDRVDDVGDPAPPAEGWAARRGTPAAELSADVIGGFPGFADYAGLIVDATVVLTDRYLLVDEGEPHGFGLAVPRLDRARADGAEVAVGYRQDGERRSFLVRARRSRRTPRPRAAAADLLAALRAARVLGELPAPDESRTSSLSWDDAAAVEHERVRWDGRATAPIAVARECTPSDVWVSQESLLWTSPRSDGVNRVALAEIVSVSPAEIADAGRSPVLYVTVGDDGAGRVDLPFVFNLHGDRDANLGDRADFLRHIRGDRLPQPPTPPRLQPWLDADDPASDPADDPVETQRADPVETEADEPEPSALDADAPAVDAPADDGIAADVPADEGTAAEGTAADGDASERAVVPDDAPVFASWPAADADRSSLGPGARRPRGERPGGLAARRWRHTRGVDGAVLPEPPPDEPAALPPALPDPEDLVLAEWSATDPAAAYAAWPGVDVALAEQPAEPPPPPTPTSSPAYERAALATIDAVLFRIRRRVEGNSAPPLTTVPPSSAEQAAALSELVELTAAGVMSPEEARARKARLVGVGEASVRLRTLLELSSAGHLSLTELVKKRDAILRGIDYSTAGEE